MMSYKCFNNCDTCLDNIDVDDKSLAESFIDDVNAAIEKYGEEVVFEEEFKKEEDLFQKALDMCDIDVSWRYNYLNNLLCELEDQSTELYEEIEKAKVDEEIAEQLINEYGFDARNDLINANKRVAELAKDLEEVEYKIEATTDIFDQIFCEIMKNLE